MITKQQSIEYFESQLDFLLAKIKERAKSQFDYNWKSNVPAEIVKPVECAEHALNNGLVSAISSFNSFDCDKTIRFAHHILEDSNCHTEARELVKFIPEYQ